MANTQYVTKNRLTKEANDSRRKVFLFGAPVYIGLLIFVPGVWWWLTAAYLILIVNAGGIKRAGAKGEDAALKMLSRLPDSYTLFNQVNIPSPRSRTGYVELDFVVIGPNGVFVIEVKNNNSDIHGTENDKEWLVKKMGQGGTPYTAKMRNPIKQVKGQVWNLSNFIKQRNYNTWIEGLVFLSNKDSSFTFQGVPSVPIFHKDGVVEYILAYRPQRAIKNQDRLIRDLAGFVANPNQKIEPHFGGSRTT